MSVARQFPKRFKGSPCSSQYSRWFKSLRRQPSKCARQNDSSSRLFEGVILGMIIPLTHKISRGEKIASESLGTSVSPMDAYPARPARQIKFPVPPKIFPVLLSREFEQLSPLYQCVRGEKPGQFGRFCGISLFFPLLNREITGNFCEFGRYGGIFGRINS